MKWLTLIYVLLVPQSVRVFLEYEYEVTYTMTNATVLWYSSCVIGGFVLAKVY